MLNKSNLTHPTMIKKIHNGMLQSQSQGRSLITNNKGEACIKVSHTGNGGKPFSFMTVGKHGVHDITDDVYQVLRSI